MNWFGKQTRTIIIDQQGNTMDETTNEWASRRVAESLEKLSQARIEVKEAMAEVRRESARNKSDSHKRWAAALLGLSDNLSEAYENLRGAQILEDIAYGNAIAKAGFERWEEIRNEMGADASDYQGSVPSWDGYSGE